MTADLKNEAMRVYAADELGADGYSPEWHATIKHAVREAAGNRCVRCGHPYEKGAGKWSPCDERCTHGGPYLALREDGTWFDYFTCYDSTGPVPRELTWARRIEAAWRILTVHHLDGDKANCRWWNLAALCQRCHLQIQGKVVMDRRWPHEHSLWFRPYVAGFYAWTYLGLDLRRDEVEARLDELLALEHRQLTLPAAAREAVGA